MSLNSPDTASGKNTARQHGAMEFTDAPVDLEQMRGYRLGRIRAELAKRDYAGILLFDQLNCRYAVDATNMQVWCSHYETRCVFVATEGPTILFDYADLPHLAEELPLIDEYRVMPSFHYFSAGDTGPVRAKEFAKQIGDLVREHGGGNKRLAIDRLSPMGADAIRNQGLTIMEGLEITEQARSVKSADEIVLMRKSIEVCEEGMTAMREALRPGITENALWAKLHETNIRLGGEWIETRLLSSGPRTNPWFRECSMREIEDGDMVSFDTDLIGPYGYCADISRAWVCGDKPNDEQRRLYAAAYEQIQHNKAVLKAGKSFRDISEQAWTIPAEFAANKYSSFGHGIGLADEYPSVKHWSVFAEKGYEGVIEAGTTFCVESCIGVQGERECVKLEEQVLVTEDGIEQLSSYPMEMDWL